MNNELFLALELLEQERGISSSYMLTKIEAALVSAFKKEYGVSPKEYRELYMHSPESDD